MNLSTEAVTWIIYLLASFTDFVHVVAYCRSSETTVMSNTRLEGQNGLVEILAPDPMERNRESALLATHIDNSTGVFLYQPR